MNMGTGNFTTERCGDMCVPALEEKFPDVERGIRTGSPGELLLAWTPVQPGQDSADAAEAEKKFMENTVLAVDSDFFKLFNFPLVRGNPETVLVEPWSLVMTEKMARKYFNSDDPVGQVIRINQSWLFTVTGVAADIPENTDLRFEFLVPFDFLQYFGYDMGNYGGNPFNNYLYLRYPEYAEQLKDQLYETFKPHLTHDVEITYNLLPFSRYHLFGEGKTIYPVIVFSVLSFLILLIACINFMNLSTARYISRTIEVGIRKVAGATRWQLIRQFMGEALVLVFIAINLAILALDLIIPGFNRSFDAHIRLDLADPMLIINLAGILIVTSIIAGSYPALFLSSFRPAQVLKKEFLSGKKGLGLRKALVITQFSFSFLFLVTTTFTFKQYNHLRTGDIGISRENIVYFPVRGELADHYNAIKADLLKNPDIRYVTTASKVPLYIDRGEFEWGKEPEVTNDLARVIEVGYDFDKVFDLHLTDGRFYSPDHSMDSVNAMIVNENLAKALGYETPVDSDFYLFNNKYTIIGVVRDFNSFPVKLGGDKLMLQYSCDPQDKLIFISIAPGNRQGIIKYIEQVHDRFNPAYPFIYFMLDDYQDPIIAFMKPTARTILHFTFFGIFISCLGLFGLAVFTSEQRTKEIGIRKAMGSSGTKIMLLFSIDFLRLVVISLIIGIPVSYLMVRIMLRQFIMQVSIDPVIFTGAALLVLVISLITVSYQSVRSANMNPANTLRYE
jgi:ABC-type antimicrobial peptide transport system permease subunit